MSRYLLVVCAVAVSWMIAGDAEAQAVRATVLGTVADNELDDLQKKAARLGGNVVLLTPERKSKGGYFGLQDYMTADVYLCEGSR